MKHDLKFDTPRQKTANILAIDDKPDNLISISALLNTLMSDCRVLTARSGPEGIEKALRVPPDTILLDIRMPGMDGYETCRRLKSNPQTRHIPIIMLTAVKTDAESYVKGLEVGADAFLSKPIDPYVLKAHIRAALKLKHAETQAKIARQILKDTNDQLEKRVKKRNAELIRSCEMLKNEIIERRNTEKALEEKSHLLESILESSLYGISTCKAVRNDTGNIIDFEFLMLNRAAIEMVGRHGLIGKRVLEEFPEQKENGLFDWYVDLVEKRRPNHREFFYGHRLELWLHITGVPLNDGFTITISDITRQKRLQDQLIQSERLAATGELAASIAHEINSPLQGISSILNLMAFTHKNDSNLFENIELLKSAFRSIRNIVKSLLDLNRPAMKARRPVNINTVITEILSLLKSYLKKNRVCLHLEFSPTLPEIIASPQQLGQVILNLVNNAVDAMNNAPADTDEIRQMPTGGMLMIKTCRDRSDIIIEISDTGPGIPDNAVSRLFEPFYTTKDNKGMGVGLSICHNIIEAHSGFISARNLPDRGAAFTIRLPLNR